MRLFIFSIGSCLAMAWSAFSIWAGSKHNPQGEFLDPETGVWDLGTLAFYGLYPLALWLLLFAVFGGLGKRRVEDERSV